MVIFWFKNSFFKDSIHFFVLGSVQRFLFMDSSMHIELLAFNDIRKSRRIQDLQKVFMSRLLNESSYLEK